MRVFDRLHVLDGDDLADQPIVDSGLERLEVGSVAEHVADANDRARLALAPKEIAALGFGLRHRLFEKEVVALRHRVHRRFVVEIVGKRDDKRIGDAPGGQQLVEVAEHLVRRNAIFRRHRLAAVRPDVRHGHHLHRLRKLLGVARIRAAARPRTHDGHRDWARRFAGEVFDGVVQFPRFRQTAGRTAAGRLARHQ